MSSEMKIRRGQDEAAVVERVVPGRLVYVVLSNEPAKRCGFKLDQMVIRTADGDLRPYRGEPLSDFGLANGSKVTVWGVEHHDVKPTLVIDAARPREFTLNIGSTISTAVNTTIGRLLK